LWRRFDGRSISSHLQQQAKSKTNNNRKEITEKEKGEKTHRHTQNPSLIMPPPQPLRLILKLPRPINARAARPIAIHKISPLDHEILDHAVELAALVALRAAQVVFRLAGAELAEVFCGARDGVGVELHFDAAEGLAAEGEVEEDDGVFGGR
jgi:hypothetical protein